MLCQLMLQACVRLLGDLLFLRRNAFCQLGDLGLQVPSPVQE